jgi:hypothetical protein
MVRHETSGIIAQWVIKNSPIVEVEIQWSDSSSIIWAVQQQAGVKIESSKNDDWTLTFYEAPRISSTADSSKLGKNTFERDWYLLWAIPVYLLSEGNFGSSIFLSSFFKFGSSILFSAPATIDGVFEKPICIFGLKKFTEYEQLRHAHGGINA